MTHGDKHVPGNSAATHGHERRADTIGNVVSCIHKERADKTSTLGKIKGGERELSYKLVPADKEICQLRELDV
jgi:hypothetical protein